MSLITLFKVQNLLMKFVPFVAFSIPFSASKNPSMQAVGTGQSEPWIQHEREQPMGTQIEGRWVPQKTLGEAWEGVG